MIKFFVFTLQHLQLTVSVLAALYCLLTLMKSSQALLWGRRALYLSAAVSAVLALLKHNTRLINQELISIALLIPLCLSLLYFLLVNLSQARRSAKAAAAAQPSLPCLIFTVLAFSALCLYKLPDFLIEPTDFVLSDVSVFSTEFLFAALGWAAAALIALLSALTFAALMKRLERRLALALTCLMLLLALCFYGSTLMQLLLLRGFLPFNTLFFELVRITRNNQDFFTYVGLCIYLAAAIFMLIAAAQRVQPGANPAQTRVRLAYRRLSRRLGLFLSVLCVIALLDLSVIQSYSKRGFTLSPAESFTQTETEALIPLEQVSDKKLHRFAYTTPDGITVRFIIIQKQGSSFGIGFDACEICGATGYYERDGQVICMLCDVVMNINTIGYKGGCNPIPLPYRIEQGQIVIELADLAAEKRRFK